MLTSFIMFSFFILILYITPLSAANSENTEVNPTHLLTQEDLFSFDPLHDTSKAKACHTLSNDETRLFEEIRLRNEDQKDTRELPFFNSYER